MQNNNTAGHQWIVVMTMDYGYDDVNDGRKQTARSYAYILRGYDEIRLKSELNFQISKRKVKSHTIRSVHDYQN